MGIFMGAGLLIMVEKYGRKVAYMGVIWEEFRTISSKTESSFEVKSPLHWTQHRYSKESTIFFQIFSIWSVDSLNLTFMVEIYGSLFLCVSTYGGNSAKYFKTCRIFLYSNAEKRKNRLIWGVYGKFSCNYGQNMGIMHGTWIMVGIWEWPLIMAETIC